jgi:hypothetical protein
MCKDTEVYLIKDENGKTHAYSRCAKSTQDGKDYCHIHSNTIKNNTSDKVKIFEKDILPKSKSDKNRWIADVNDPYFEEMGKRGAKKKNCENTYTFVDSKHPVKDVLEHKNAKLSTLLTIYASSLLKYNGEPPNDIEIKIEKDPSKIGIKKEETLDNLISMITTIDSHSDISEDECESENDNNDSDQESVSCIPIYTKDKQELWYNPENKMVYKMCDENGDGTELGELKEISNEFHTLEYNNKYYTIVNPYKSKKNGNCFKCIFTNVLFDKNMNFIEII